MVADAFSPVTLEKYAECYITVNDAASTYFSDQLVVTDQFETKYVAVFYEKGQHFHISNLPLGRDFSVSYFNDCGKKTLLGHFKSSYESGRLLPVSASLYELIAQLSINSGSQPNTYREILSSSDVPDFEKASFFQRYFLKGKAVNVMADLFDESLVLEKTARGCNCEQVLHQFFLNPGELDYIRGNVLDEGPILEEDANKLEFQLHTAGAAKAWRAYSDGGRESRNTPFGGAVGANGATVTDVSSLSDLPNDFTLESRISMNLFCNAGATPENCGCNKIARSRIFYESQIGVRSQIGSGSGEKNAFAAGEDIALAYQLKRDGTATGEFTFLGGFVNTARDSCGQMPNSEFWSSAISATFGIATLVATIIVGDSSSTAFGPTQVMLVDEIGDDIADIFTTSSTINSGECSSQLQVQLAPSRLDLQPDITLQPNIPTEIGIATRARLISMGMRSWQSEVTLASGFSIATVHPAGLASSRDDEECCLDRTEVSYISRSFDASIPLANLIPPVSSQLNLQVDAASFIRSRANDNFDFLGDRLGRYYTQYEFGTALASRRFDDEKCQLKPSVDTIIGPAIIGGKAFDLTTNNESFNEAHLNKTEYRYFTINGKLIGTSQANATITDFGMKRYLENSGLAAGIYLVHSIKNGISNVRKIHLNR